MSSSECDSEVVSEDDEEGKMYQLIYELHAGDEKQKNEEVQTPSSFRNPPVRVKINAGRADAVVNKDSKALDMHALDHIQEIPVKEKPWKEVGSQISDYFNYGFNEGSWSIYCKRQGKLRAANRRLRNKCTVQKRRPTQGQTSSRPASPGSTSPPALRRGRAGCSSAAGGPQCPSDSQVEMSPERDRFTSPPPDYSSLFAYAPPPPFLYRQGTRSSSHLSPLDSGRSKGFEDSSAPLHQRPLGASSLIPRSKASNAGRIGTTKDGECYLRQESCDRSRSRGPGRAERDASGGRPRDRGSCSSSYSGEERRHKRFDRYGGDRKEGPGERRPRDGEQEASSSRRRSNRRRWSRRRSRRSGAEDRNSQSGQNKAKRNRKETNETPSADPEGKLKHD